MPHYVYIYYDSRQHKQLEPIYVGKGQDDRFHFHWEIKCFNLRLRRKLDKIRAAGLKPVIKIMQHFENKETAFAYEVQLIKEYGRIDLGTGTLCNYTDGGEGWGSISFSSEVKERHRAAVKQSL